MHNIVKILKYLNNYDKIEYHLKLIFGLLGKMSMKQHSLICILWDTKILDGLIAFSTVACDVHNLSILEVVPKGFLLKNKALAKKQTKRAHPDPYYYILYLNYQIIN